MSCCRRSNGTSTPCRVMNWPPVAIGSMRANRHSCSISNSVWTHGIATITARQNCQTVSTGFSKHRWRHIYIWMPCWNSKNFPARGRNYPSSTGGVGQTRSRFAEGVYAGRRCDRSRTIATGSPELLPTFYSNHREGAPGKSQLRRKHTEVFGQVAEIQAEKLHCLGRWLRNRNSANRLERADERANRRSILSVGEKNRPRRFSAPSGKGHKQISHRVALERLGILRLLHRFRFADLAKQNPAAWKRYDSDNRRWRKDGRRRSRSFIGVFHSSRTSIPCPGRRRIDSPVN